MNARDPKSGAWFVSHAYQRYGSDLRRYLARRLHNDQDARELAQEVWTRLLRIRDAREILEPLAYIYRAASNVVAEFHMRNKRERVSFDSEASDEAAEHPHEPSRDELEEQLSRQRQLERALAELPKVYRNVVLLKIREDLSYKEIGKRLGFRTRTVEQYFYRALVQLRNRRER